MIGYFKLHMQEIMDLERVYTAWENTFFHSCLYVSYYISHSVSQEIITSNYSMTGE